MIERKILKGRLRDIQIENFLKEELKRSGCTHISIEKTPLVTRIVLYLARPGLAIGKKGGNITKLNEKLRRDFNIENPQIEIEQISPFDAQYTADRIASVLESGRRWRGFIHKVIKETMEKGAQGIEIKLKGVIAGKGQRKRQSRFHAGYIKKVGNMRLLVDHGATDAITKAGIIGVKVAIVYPEVIFPDKINLDEKIKIIKTEEIEKKIEEREKDKIVEAKKEEEKQTKKRTKKTSEKKEGGEKSEMA